MLNKYRLAQQKDKIPQKEWSYFLKWLRYYLDFCNKYGHDNLNSDSLPLFIEKLQSKNQNTDQQLQASTAIRFLYSLSQKGSAKFNVRNKTGGTAPVKEKIQQYTAKKGVEKKPSHSRVHSRIPDKPCKEKWQRALSGLADEIKVRHYSPKTLKSYRSWVVKLQVFTGSKDPELLDSEDVKRFLTYQAVKVHVSASSQNLAFNSLLFFYRHVLGREFGKIDGVVRAKRRPYIPIVL